MINMPVKPTESEIDNFDDDQLKDLFRQSLIDNQPDIELELLEQQVQFLFDRTMNFGSEIMTPSQISDLAFKLGLTDNHYILRTVESNYDFSKQ